MEKPVYAHDPLKDVIENRLKKIREEEQNLQEIRQICNLILENNISFTAVDEKMLTLMTNGVRMSADP